MSNSNKRKNERGHLAIVVTWSIDQKGQKVLPLLEIHDIISILLFKNLRKLLSCGNWNSTGKSYQNESSDSVSHKLLDELENAFNTK